MGFSSFSFSKSIGNEQRFNSGSTKVFAKRREGAIDEAYQMALQLMSAPDVSEWDAKAFGWCLIDLIKRDAQSENKQNLAHYRQQLESIKVDTSDEILHKNIRYALSLCNPLGHLISQAKALSKQERHAEAADLYRKVWLGGAADLDTQTSLGWELYKSSKNLITTDGVNLGVVKRNLNDYLKLTVEKPSLLHSCFLSLAAKLAGQATFSMLVFSRLWNLEYLRPDDFNRFRADDNKEYPSLAEKVIQQAGKEAAVSDNANEQNYILSHIDTAINRFPDNVWLKLDKAKVLLALGRHDEALAFGLAVTKSKVNDYWAWELLGDIYVDKVSFDALSCYCKALLCSTDDKFTGKVRLKLAQIMVQSNEFAAAKCEVDFVIRYREAEGQKIPVVATHIASQDWYSETIACQSNDEYYRKNSSAVEALLFSNIPWINANVGIMYNVPGTDDRKPKRKRKIFLKTSSIPMEINIPESKFKFPNLELGDGLRLKGEMDERNQFQVYLIEKRISNELWDVIVEKIGVVSYLNNEKGVLHFIVDMNINGVIPFSDLSSIFHEGDAILLRLSLYTTSKGQFYRALHSIATDKEPSQLIKKHFCDVVSVDNGMGFTKNDIFISPTLVQISQIVDGQEISGFAILNFNKKRSSWGWKAVSIENIHHI